MGDFGGVYLVTFIHLLHPSAFLEYFLILGFGVFWGHFWDFEIFENVFGMRIGDFVGGLFSEIYSFESFLYNFWILDIFGGNFWVFEMFKIAILNHFQFTHQSVFWFLFETSLHGFFIFWNLVLVGFW